MQSPEPLVSDAPLIVYVDIKSPYAFVAIRPTMALEEELGVQFDWRPLTLDIPSYLGSARKKKGKVVQSKRSATQWNRVKYAYKDTRRYAEQQGYILKGTEKIWDSSLANIGILWAVQQRREQLKAYFEAVYPPFWRRELDIENRALIEQCLRQADIPTEGFADFEQGEGREQHDHLQAVLHASGIYGVPTYIADELILFGREHLPLVRWHLQGRKHPAPDIAYEFA